ncbi:MAG: DUF2723 domain-containing protein, partial [Chloroflexi bacterium]|nr:DUF2723 domain-containing protein [Chloroflexota bacterium]
MSAVFASLAVFLIFLIVRNLTHREFPAFVAGATVAFSSTFWSNSLWAEAHTLNAFFTVLIIYLMLRWRDSGDNGFLYFSFLALGLGLGNHRLVMLLFPAMLYFAFVHRDKLPPSPWWKAPLWAGLALALGFSVHAYLPIRALQDPLVEAGYAGNLRSFLNMVVLGNNQPGDYDFSLPGIWGRRSVLWAFPRYDFTVPGLALSLVGVARLLRTDRHFLVLTLVPALLTSLVVLTFLIHDVYDYFIPIYLMLGIWLGVGAYQLAQWVSTGLTRFTALNGGMTTPRGARFAVYPLLLTLPAVLFMNNFHSLDRSKDYDAYDFAYNTLTNVAQDAVIVADWWTYYPLLYQQAVNNLGHDVVLTNILSAVYGDPVAYVEQKLSEGRTVYIAEGLRTRTIGLSQRFTLVPVALHAITSPVTNYLPRPEYKDLLAIRRDVYQVLPEKPALAVSQVPQGAEINATFGETLSLRGLEIRDPEVAAGGSLTIDYYWQMEQETEDNLYAKVLFVDAEGRIQQREGFPTWFQAYELGKGIHPTSGWEPGLTVREQYHTLVPRTVPPGTYYLQIRVYEGKGQTRELVPDTGAGQGGTIVGMVTVVG